MYFFIHSCIYSLETHPKHKQISVYIYLFILFFIYLSISLYINITFYSWFDVGLNNLLPPFVMRLTRLLYFKLTGFWKQGSQNSDTGTHTVHTYCITVISQT